MVFAEFVDITFPAALNIFFFPENIRVVAGFLDVLRKRFQTNSFNTLDQALTLDQFAQTLTVLSFFYLPILDSFDIFLDFIIWLFNLDKRHEQGTHLRTVKNRRFGSNKN